MPTVLAVVGARPNFVKMAPVTAALADRGVSVRLLHTGQHYDRALSDGFIERLGMPQPDANLGVGSGSHAEQTAGVLTGVETDLLEHPAELALVAGDVNSTMAAALAATKLHVAVAHVESGLRSRDWTMPEEVNRVVTDRVSDLLLCTSEDAISNLAAEGIVSGVELVGNTMIDSLFRILEGTDREAALEAAGVEARGYTLVTLHRPALVDHRDRLLEVLEVLGEVSRTAPVLFPAHPRTVAHLEEWGIELPELVRLAAPMDYAEFVALEAEARLVITDSGGVQEETSVLGVPCLTYRDSTERPVTVELGTNTLVGTDAGALRDAAIRALSEEPPDAPSRIPHWDGAAGPRAAEAIVSFLDTR
ncbi:MAG TPA: UDP-N-acetylglucosamine 2-epimerase (non-hydrolyzing) [Solirubrobacterales bacterium]|jgi:UDP-N-acetylglucosamine 2-epimerase (non-hydrolysing)|nr:UDP-N-acetylglucosamine 2-epimerase (non-hydrolyzing) [Solirubrobacterales bacterium]